MVNSDPSPPSCIASDPGPSGTATPELSPMAALASLKDPQARFGWLVDWARQQPPLPDECRRETCRVAGCQVRLWWIPEIREGRCWFRSDSDAVSLKALTRLLAAHYSGKSAAEILAGERAPLERLGLLRHLADNRRATILRVEEQIHEFARIHR